MSFSDVFKKSFLNNYVGNISIQQIIVTLFMSLIFSFVIFYVYKLVNKNIVYSKKFNIAMSLISIITSSVVLAMQANIVVSLGMVGALSIVRFRTAIKEPMDLLFLFWSITNGIIVGVGVYSLAILLAIILTIALLVFDVLPSSNIPYVLLVNLKKISDEENLINLFHKSNISYKLKSRNVTSENIEYIYELRGKNIDKFNEELSKIKNITNYNLLTQDGECN